LFIEPLSLRLVFSLLDNYQAVGLDILHTLLCARRPIDFDHLHGRIIPEPEVCDPITRAPLTDGGIHAVPLLAGVADQMNPRPDSIPVALFFR